MFSASSSSKVTLFSAILMILVMMMVMTQIAAKPHLKLSKRSAEKMVPLHLDPNDLVQSTKTSSAENSSISPWTYNITRDDSLFPHMLSEAHCLLEGCLNAEGQEDLNLRSRPIKHQVLVLRRVKTAVSGSSYHYRLESRLIQVGCTCVRPPVHVQQ